MLFVHAGTRRNRSDPLPRCPHAPAPLPPLRLLYGLCRPSGPSAIKHGLVRTLRVLCD